MCSMAHLLIWSNSFLFVFLLRLLDVFFTSYVSLLSPLVRVHWPYRVVSLHSLKALAIQLNSTDSSVSFVFVIIIIIIIIIIIVIIIIIIIIIIIFIIFFFCRQTAHALPWA